MFALGEPLVTWRGLRKGKISEMRHLAFSLNIAESVAVSGPQRSLATSPPNRPLDVVKIPLKSTELKSTCAYLSTSGVEKPLVGH